MRILLVSPFFPPEVGSAAHLYYELGQALRGRGHEVTVLTGLPRYHVVEPHAGGRSRPFIREKYHGLKVFRVFNLDIPWDRPLLRGVDQMVAAAATLLAGCSLPPFEVAMVYSPPLPLALAALVFCGLRGRPLVLNVQDLFPQSAIDLGVLSNPYLIQAFRQLEAFLYRHATLITAHSAGNRRYILEAGGDPGKVTVISNWVDTDTIRPFPRHNSLRAALGLNDCFLVSFAGIFGYSQDLETVLASADRLRDRPDIAFLLVGDGVEKPGLMALARELNLTNVHFLPMQPKDKYPDVLAASDLCLATLRRDVRTPVVPSKILSIMAAGRPVLASLPPDGDAPRLIAEAGCGLCVPPGDADAMAGAIRQLADRPDWCVRLGASGRLYAQRHLSLSRGAEILEGYFQQITPGMGLPVR